MSKRNDSIDFLCGLVMIIMALDHVRDLMHVTSLLQSPTDLNTTSPVLFFTRWITYLCAPTFVFLSGTSAYLSLEAKKDSSAARRFLIWRGLLLIALEFTVVNFGIWFDVKFRFMTFEVISAIGVGFIILAFLIRLPPKIIGVLGSAILLTHNLIPLLPSAENIWLNSLLRPLVSPSLIPLGGERLLFIAYPPLPWLGILLVGFGAGRYFQSVGTNQKQLFLEFALVALGAFSVIRLSNIYGDPLPWTMHKTPVNTFLSFINVTKYPPSLQFCLLFFGIMFLILSAVQRTSRKWSVVVRLYGKTPLFYFLVHWYILHPMVFVMVYLQGFRASDLLFGTNFGRPKTGSGLALWWIYVIWISLVICMYPLCKWYWRYKTAHPQKKWLRYI